MENHTAYATQTQSSHVPLQAAQAGSPHSAVLSTDSLNDLLRLFASQKTSVLSDTHGFKAMALLSPTLDSAVFQPAEHNSQIRANPQPSSIHQLSSLGSSIDVIHSNSSTPQTAYNLDALSSVGKSDSVMQVSTDKLFSST